MGDKDVFKKKKDDVKSSAEQILYIFFNKADRLCSIGNKIFFL